MNEATPAAKVRKAFELTLSRSPTDAELAIVEKFLNAAEPMDEGDKQKADLTRLERFAQSLLASNEFYFVP